MEVSIGTRLKNAWNVFKSNPIPHYQDLGMSYYYRPDRRRFSRGNERSLITSVYNRIAMDAAAIDIKHVRVDNNDRYLETIPSGLNKCLSLEANIDQTGRAFIQDVVMSLLDEGSVAIVPVDTDTSPDLGGSYKIETMRTGKILEWFPAHVKLLLYNERTGKKEEVILSKKNVAIVENPLYSVMNEPNSILQRLIRKLNLLDVIDEQSGSGKLNMIIQLPYVIKTESRKIQAENRRKEIEEQLSNSKYGIAYADGTERITQLNRPLENNLMGQIEYLLKLFFSQLGITETVMDGTADEKTMLNYYERTVSPILTAIVEAMTRTFLTKTARTQGQAIRFYRNLFKLVPVSNLAEIADKMTRNEIMSSNEIRQIMGLKPSSDPNADALKNKNLKQPNEDASNPNVPLSQEEYDMAMSDLDDSDNQLDELEEEMNSLSDGFDDENDDKKLKHYASPYYDPVKAHEYYMKNRELKGKSNSVRLNEEGRNAARYVKEQLNNERQNKVDAHKAKTDSDIENLRSEKDTEIAANASSMNRKITQLREQVKHMSKEEKFRRSEQIYGMIDSLRTENQETRIRLQNAFSESSQSLRNEHGVERNRLKTEYDAKYEQELEKIRSDPAFQYQTKRKRRS